MTKTPENTTEPDLSGIHIWLVLWKAARTVEAKAQQSIARFGMVQSDFGVLEALLQHAHIHVRIQRRRHDKVHRSAGRVPRASGSSNHP